ncbi:AI-2E family transporter [Sporolactobacillus sp. CPB3-1]|uniref:AI-2E family transporter n=1 Tax=Sporolactobacillus mangiferae TaxID=2940498 RepID=A0ABT0M6G7_9BACL|nr:AI-2E family transporter [Sporolactobacillus mangiferae]MCL1630465.1 AI-2E family transporter [Sporolactobacillus mangiferae]
MRNWTALQWMKGLSISLLLFLNGYLFYRLLPLIGTVAQFLLHVAVPFLAAAIIAYLLHPLVGRVQRIGLPRTIAILSIYALFFGVAGLTLYKGGPILLHELRGLDDDLTNYQKIYQTNVDHVYGSTPEAIHDQVNEALARIRSGLMQSGERVMDWCSGVVQSFLTLLIIPFLSFYILKDAGSIRKHSQLLIPERWRQQTVDLCSEMDRSIGKYIRGQLTVCAILAVMATIGLWILKVPYPIVFGLFIGSTDLIPYFGPFIGAAPAVLVAATKSFYSMAGVVLMIILIQFLEGSVIEPLVVGKSAEIHPLYIMLAVGIGGDLAGIVGMLLAIPCFIVIRTCWRHLNERFRFIDK